MALIQQESGGRHLDVLQSSESIGLPPGAITDPEYSIQIGVKYFAEVMKQAKGDIYLALQAYNFGNGFIGFALERGGYSKEVTIDFSNMMATKMGWSRYGDVNYVKHVLRYYNDDKLAVSDIHPNMGSSWFTNTITRAQSQSKQLRREN
jgi:soluble lytic murein transglycosylase-like protein